MQYILTQSEYDALTPVKMIQERNEALETARKLILKQSQFTCIHDRVYSRISEIDSTYCDDCPIGNIHNTNHESMKHICVSPKNYSK